MKNRTKAAIVATAVVGVAAIGGGVALAAGGGDDGSESSITGEELDRASEAALEHTGGGRVTDTEKGDEESLYEVEVTLDDGTEVDVQLDADFAVVGDERDESDDADDGAETAATAEERERASDAALAHTGGGEVTEVDKGDDGVAYQVEVRLDDGSEVDVHLDDGFQVVGEDRDSDTPDGD